MDKTNESSSVLLGNHIVTAMLTSLNKLIQRFSLVCMQLVLGAIDAGFDFPCQPYVVDKDPRHVRVNVTIQHFIFQINTLQAISISSIEHREQWDHFYKMSRNIEFCNL